MINKHSFLLAKCILKNYHDKNIHSAILILGPFINEKEDDLIDNKKKLKDFINDKYHSFIAESIDDPEIQVYIDKNQWLQEVIGHFAPAADLIILLLGKWAACTRLELNKIMQSYDLGRKCYVVYNLDIYNNEQKDSEYAQLINDIEINHNRYHLPIGCKGFKPTEFDIKEYFESAFDLFNLQRTESYKKEQKKVLPYLIRKTLW